MPGRARDWSDPALVARLRGPETNRAIAGSIGVSISTIAYQRMRMGLRSPAPPPIKASDATKAHADLMRRMGVPANEIASRLGVSRSWVARTLSRRSGTQDRWTQREIRLLVGDRTDAALAEELGVPVPTVQYHRRKMGIARRDPGKSMIAIYSTEEERAAYAAAAERAGLPRSQWIRQMLRRCAGLA